MVPYRKSPRRKSITPQTRLYLSRINHSKFKVGFMQPYLSLQSGLHSHSWARVKRRRRTRAGAEAQRFPSLATRQEDEKAEDIKSRVDHSSHHTHIYTPCAGSRIRVSALPKPRGKICEQKCGLHKNVYTKQFPFTLMAKSF